MMVHFVALYQNGKVDPRLHQLTSTLSKVRVGESFLNTLAKTFDTRKNG